MAPDANTPLNPQSETPKSARSLYTKSQLRLAFLGAFTGWIIVGILFSVLLIRGFIFVRLTNVPFESQNVSINNFIWKLEYTIRWSILPISWLVFYLHIVATKRGFSNAANPLSGNEHIVEMNKNIFSNSIEQFVISFAAQVSLITWIRGIDTQVIIPVVNILFVVGRVLFWLGYPKRRSPGMVFTMFPSMLMTAYSLFQLLTHMSFRG